MATEPFYAPDIDQPEKQEMFSKKKRAKPSWKTIGRGINFEGVCKNQKCPAFKKKGWSKLGLGEFDMAEYIYKIPCAECQHRLKDIAKVGIYNCNFEGVGWKTGSARESVVNKTHVKNAQKAGFLQFGTTIEDLVQYEYLTFTTWKLDNDKPETYSDSLQCEESLSTFQSDVSSEAEVMTHAELFQPITQ